MSLTLPVLLPLFDAGDDNPQATPTVPALPDFVLPAIDGSTVRLTETARAHDVIVLVFHRGASCQDCRDQLIELQTGYATLQEQDVEILAVGLDGEQNIQTMAEQIGVGFPMLYDGSPVATLYGFQQNLESDYTTVTMLVDNDGRAVGAPVGTLPGEVLPVSALIEATANLASAAGLEG